MNNSWEIQEFDMPSNGIFNIELPHNARVLSVQSHFIHGDGWTRMWVLLDPHAEKKSREFHSFCNGLPVPRDLLGVLNFVDTYQADDGSAFHIFERL